MSMPAIDQLIVWAIIGLIGGSLAGMILTWEKQGLGWAKNLGLGLAGALVGGFLFRIFGFMTRLDTIAISLRDVVAAVTGSFLLLGARWFWGKYRDKQT